MLKSEIKIGIWGLILEGAEQGNHVQVEPTGDNFLILLQDPEIKNQVFDYWVENEVELEAFFAESKWKVDWSIDEL